MELTALNIAKNIIKILIVTVVFFALNPIIHSVIESFVVTEEAIVGTPDLTLLFVVIFIQSIFLVLAFNLVKDYIPGKKDCHKGILFMIFFLISVQIPSVFGVIAFEVGKDWLFFTPAKIANYVTLLSDTIIFIIMGVIIGKLFSSTKQNTIKKSKNLCPTVILGAILFPIIFLISMMLINSLVFGGGDFLPANGSTWFNLVFYGIFFMTGASIPILHNLILQNKKRNQTKNILLTTFIFLLLWMPVQNFMIVFGWNFLEGFVFSLVSIIPIFIIVLIADFLLKK
jgi:hypothetical protein